MTPDELVDRVRKSVDGVEIDAGPRDAALALLRAGMTIVGIALRRLDDGVSDRETGNQHPRVPRPCGRSHGAVAFEGELMNQPDNEGGLADADSTRHLETPAHASPYAPNASPAPNGGSPRAQKQRKAAAEEFPIRLSINITHAMNDALERMRRRTRLKQAVVARLGLMDYLARHDPQYRETD
jgi:hypothetical protein